MKNIELKIKNVLLKNKALFNKFGTFLIVAVVLFATFYRVNTWQKSTSFFIDEANVVCNIAERSYTELWQQLDYKQYAPPIFLTVTKLSTKGFGISEKSTRLIALISSILSFILIIYFCKYYFEDKFLIAIILFFYSFNYSSVFFANQVKQYSTDLLVALFLMILALNLSYKKSITNTYLLVWIIVGSFCIWLSMPSVFILASIGFYYFFKAKQNKQHFLFFKKYSIVVTVWLVNFALYFFLILKTDADTNYLQNFHTHYFIKVKFWKLSSLQSNWRLLKINIETFIGSHPISIFYAIILFFLGIWHIIKSWKNKYILIVFPLVFCLLSACLRYYSLIPRLNYFLLINVLIICFLGFTFAFKKLNFWLKPFLTVLTFFVLYQINGWQFALKLEPIFMEETKSALYFVATNKKEDEAVLVNFGATSVYLTYLNHHKSKANYSNLQNAKTLHWQKNANQHIKDFFKNSNSKKVWFIWGHDEQYSILNDKKTIAQNYTVLKNKTYWRAAAILIEEK